ncbi:C-type lectin domain family 4 member A-like isoform X1 [Aquila chrysaetos chrysaetos]|uniref:C-type lectin domain family 4 member A-like isoform X1 n=1 Tax=Aquila chrysaetos chrysaetos TaxID=223781 RepID=UPI0011764FA7|nr:C-type lectin domain family 4 member A-like isoform X1 [Aquila chrysaetos chrysaetos]
MASEITYAEVKFKNASPAAVGKVPPEKKKREHHPQKYPLWLPWLISLLLLLVCIALVTALLVAPFFHSGDQPTALQQNFMEWRCISALPQGKEQGWTCCPKGWKRFQKSCYFFSNDTMHGIESEQNCTGMGSHLVVINSEAEQAFLSKEVQLPFRGENYYIGLSAQEVGQWHWVDDTPFNATAAPRRREKLLLAEPLGLPCFCPCHQNCLCNGLPCSFPSWKLWPVQDSAPECYRVALRPQRICRQRMSWLESEQNCTGMGSHLVVINSEAEQEFLFNLAKGVFTKAYETKYYIGLSAYKNGQWQWVDQTPYKAAATFWKPGEPNLLFAEKCAAIHVKGNRDSSTYSNWNNILCFTSCYRICELEVKFV